MAQSSLLTASVLRNFLRAVKQLVAAFDTTTGHAHTGTDSRLPRIGASGTEITQVRVYSQTITPAAVLAAVVAEQTFDVTGLTTADKVVVNPSAWAQAVGVVGARVSAADTLAVRFVNPTAGALTPSAGTWTIVAIRS